MATIHEGNLLPLNISKACPLEIRDHEQALIKVWEVEVAAVVVVAEATGVGSSPPQKVQIIASFSETCESIFTFAQISIDHPSVAVSSAEFPPSRDGSDLLLIVNGKYVVSAKPVDFPPGQMGMSEPQRTWMAIALTDVLHVEIYDVFSQGSQAYLGSMDIEVGFASKNKQPQTPYDQDDLAKEVTKVRNSYTAVVTKLKIIRRYFKTKCLHLVRDLY